MARIHCCIIALVVFVTFLSTNVVVIALVTPTSHTSPVVVRTTFAAVSSLSSVTPRLLISTNDRTNDKSSTALSLFTSDRRDFLSSLMVIVTTSSLVVPVAAVADDDDDESFESIVARAAKMSAAVVEAEDEEEDIPKKKTVPKDKDSRTAYDFELPVGGQIVRFEDVVRQEKEAKEEVKAILVVNIKQDDPIARKNIPELITLAAKYGRSGEFVVICAPTDQGYYEPDTSALIRLKMASEYGYGINPATILTDKMNVLGTGAHPFWRWLEGNCRTPSGLGKIQANFEKFLIDGKTGLPLRRYPRKYSPFDIADDIEALLGSKTFPPAGSNWREEWRNAYKEAERDTYRFQKGLNVFDQ